MKKITFQNSLSAMTLTLLTMLMAVISTGCSNDSSFDLKAASGSLATEENEDVVDMASQITFLSVWRNKKTEAFYVCVKKATGDNDQGIMLSLEDHENGNKEYASTEAIDALAKCQIERPNDYEKMLDYMAAKATGDYNFKYVKFVNFRRLYYTIGGNKIRPDGQITTRIMSRKGGTVCQSWFYKRGIPKHIEGALSSDYIVSHEFRFTPKTRLDNREWECMKH